MNKIVNNPSYCVLIPTYNNGTTLKKVVDNVLCYVESNSILIINDGSTDATADILASYSTIKQIHFKKNKGKGAALRKGFKETLKLGFTHAVTIDSDDQHFPEDIPLLIKAAQAAPTTLFIGSRNMNQEGVPSKSNFGNHFSNFWFWVETGKKLTDTQSGFRLYPIAIMPKKWYSSKFEFEIESIVRSYWKGIPVENIPIQIRYDFEGRVSHFRPFKDFIRISVVNSCLFFTAIFYIYPRNFIRQFKKKTFREFIKEDVLGNNDSPKIKAFSLALGVFIGILPIWGFQTVVVLFLAVVLRLNKLLAFAASNISIPPMIPIIVYASLKIGSRVLNSSINENFMSFENIKTYLIEYIVGSFILAILVALIVGITSFVVLTKIKKSKTKNG